MKNNVYEFKDKQWGPYTLHAVVPHWTPISHRGPGVNERWFAESPAKVIEKMSQDGELIEHKFDNSVDQARKILDILEERNE